MACSWANVAGNQLAASSDRGQLDGKKVNFGNVKFSAKLIRTAIDKLSSSGKEGLTTKFSTLSVRNKDEKWRFDTLEEFFDLYRNNTTGSCIIRAEFSKDYSQEFEFELEFISRGTEISVSAKSRPIIESVLSIFSEADASERFVTTEETTSNNLNIFIGHGRNPQWGKIKDHLQDKHGISVVAYETGARSGHTIRDILDSMIEESSLALLVLTGEDKTESGIRARQNVIHECGLFQGRLGFDRAIMIVEQGVELASNFDGIQQIRFKRGHISEVFGDVLATIRREFGAI